jgi:hypothetical protein
MRLTNRIGDFIMTVTQQQRQQSQADLAALQVKDRYKIVTTNPAAIGKMDLAMVLLGSELSVEQIITALGKAPSTAAAPAASTSSTSDDPALAAFGNSPAPGGMFDPELFAAGAEMARILLGKSDK